MKNITTNSVGEQITMFNGNDQVYHRNLPKFVIIGHLNDSAIAHILKQTGLQFTKDVWGTYSAQPTSSQQLMLLLLTYNYKTQYEDNGTNKHTIFFKSMHHVGFNVESVCVDCLKRNRIPNSLNEGEYLSC
jgi:hypothetical protein